MPLLWDAIGVLCDGVRDVDLEWWTLLASVVCEVMSRCVYTTVNVEW